MISIIWNIWNRWFHRTRNRFEATRDKGKGAKKELLLNGYRDSIQTDGKLFDIVLMVAHHCKCN